MRRIGAEEGGGTRTVCHTPPRTSQTSASALDTLCGTLIGGIFVIDSRVAIANEPCISFQHVYIV